MEVTDYPDILSPFELKRLVGTHILFHNARLAEDLKKLPNSIVSEESFLQDFSFVMEEMAQMWQLQIDNSHTKSVYAEHYGGDGIGRNGGGVRCANDGNVLLKGIGTNHLVGKDTKFSHANGSLALLDAVTETIYSEVLLELLPVGTVRCLGILVTGADKAYCPFSSANADDTTVGAILVREKCFRPAHLMRSAFIPHIGLDQGNKFAEFNRLKRLFTSIQPEFASQGGFVKVINQYLYKQADQFAFARIARIFHGAVSSSNVAIDGKWLDLNTASFVEPGVNFAMSESSTPLAEEHKFILQIYNELAYTYAKNIGRPINFSEIKTKYIKHYKAQQRYHSPWVLGLSRKATQSAADPEATEILCSSFATLLETGPDIVTPVRKRDRADESLKEYLAQIFLDAWEHLNKQRADISNKTGTALGQIIQAVYHGSKHDIKFDAFFNATFLTAFKRANHHPVFCRARINDTLVPLIRSENYSAISNVISTCITSAQWLFSSSENYVLCLFNGSGLTLNYQLKTDCYELSDSGSKQQYCLSLRDAICYIQTYRDKFYLLNYDFGLGLLASLQFLEELHGE